MNLAEQIEKIPTFTYTKLTKELLQETIDAITSNRSQLKEMSIIKIVCDQKTIDALRKEKGEAYEDYLKLVILNYDELK